MTQHRPLRQDGRRPGWRHAAERRLAPHVDEAWAEAFVLELRLRDVPGRAIGDALAEVESHCAESGESAAEAFGEPAPYATSLELPTSPLTALSPARSLRWLVQAVGLVLTTSAAAVWRQGQPLELTTGHAALVAVLGLTTVGVALAADRALRALVEHPVRVWALTMVHMGLLVGILLLLDDVLVTVPAETALALGAGLLVVGTVALLRDLQRDTAADDPVTSTVEAGSRPEAGSRRATALRLAPALLAPVVAVLVISMWVALT